MLLKHNEFFVFESWNMSMFVPSLYRYNIRNDLMYLTLWWPRHDHYHIHTSILRSIFISILCPYFQYKKIMTQNSYLCSYPNQYPSHNISIHIRTHFHTISYSYSYAYSHAYSRHIIHIHIRIHIHVYIWWYSICYWSSLLSWIGLE